jgi:DDE_Tnp_1-associated
MDTEKEELEKMVKSLLETFKTIPDPRGKNGKRHPLPAILVLSVAAMISGARSLYAIFQWGRLQPPEVVITLGFVKKNGQSKKTPCVATLHRVFKRLDVVKFEAALRDWSQANLGDEEAIAIDGKGLMGIHGEELPGVRLLAAYTPQSGLVVAQKGEIVT